MVFLSIFKINTSGFFDFLCSSYFFSLKLLLETASSTFNKHLQKALFCVVITNESIAPPLCVTALSLSALIFFHFTLHILKSLFLKDQFQTMLAGPFCAVLCYFNADHVTIISFSCPFVFIYYHIAD